MAKIVLAGGTGNLGRLLINLFQEQGHKIIVLSRQKNHSGDSTVQYVNWDAENLGPWQKELDNADVLINLCGLSINRRFTKKNKELLWKSRIIPTTLLGEAISTLENPVKLWINFSGVSIFNAAKSLQDENGKDFANDFLGTLAKDWENAFKEAKTKDTEKVILRMSPILSQKSGMFAELYPLAKMGLGGKVGDGKQMVSWIHESDFIRLIDWIVKSSHRELIYHACSPNPVSNAEFMHALRKECKVSFGLPLPSVMAKIGAFIKGVDPVLLLESVPVTTILTIKNGFKFNFPYIQPAFNTFIKSST
ncbi:TIGR01777 family oxidoreductase [Sphingobacterium endophyticum]|uniref:TIGR01777 family oxidoreductase n=1 Tax=Sphingobacterium endophyticum TaxID=2546448 RepID=UPI0012E311AD|nr:TIGR01777 family oxidoreductase [Sphingobacterium endophyticum]